MNDEFLELLYNLIKEGHIDINQFKILVRGGNTSITYVPYPINPYTIPSTIGPYITCSVTSNDSCNDMSSASSCTDKNFNNEHLNYTTNGSSKE